ARDRRNREFVRAPGGCERRTSPGALCCRSGSPPIPAETGREYSNYSLARIVADIGRSYGVGHQQSFSSGSEASGGQPRGSEATSALTTGGSGGICLWLALE